MPDKLDNGWSLDAYVAHNEALRLAERRLQEEVALRLTQLREADQRALEIKAQGDKEVQRVKEENDRESKQIDRDTRAYKDERANALREQIGSERGLYATKEELKPVIEYIAAQQGEKGGRLSTQQMFLIVIPGVIVSLLIIGGIVISIAYAIRK